MGIEEVVSLVLIFNDKENWIISRAVLERPAKVGNSPVSDNKSIFFELHLSTSKKVLFGGICRHEPVRLNTIYHR